jgi:nucleoside triphosphate pyrophosphatase
MPHRLVLASGSPRRRELLADLGFDFEVVPSAVVESLPSAPPPGTVPALAVGLALAKARDVASRLAPAAVVLGADTVVVVDGRPLGKPASREDARRMLDLLAGRAHEVVTGVAVVAGDWVATEAVVTRVVMRAYAAGEIEAYVATAEPYDKAGAYAVQGEGARLVAQVDGCRTNVIGLPVTTTARLLRAAGVGPIRAPAGAPPGPPGPP